jgi:CRP-like cAMP-binding protein
MDIVGEFEAIGEYPARAANVIALGDVSGRIVSREDYLSYLLAHPAAALALVRVMILRLGAADRRRIAVTSADAVQALAQYIIELVDGARERNVSPARVAIPLAQHDLASLLALSRNSLVRALATLRAGRLIATQGHTITILDEPALRRSAEEDLPPAAQ